MNTLWQKINHIIKSMICIYSLMDIIYMSYNLSQRLCENNLKYLLIILLSSCSKAPFVILSSPLLIKSWIESCSWLRRQLYPELNLAGLHVLSSYTQILSPLLRHTEEYVSLTEDSYAVRAQAAGCLVTDKQVHQWMISCGEDVNE